MTPDAGATPTTLDAGRYVVVRRLGRGGMATVYQAWDGRLEVWRAIKLLDSSFAPTSGARLRFENEARTMARLQHPNVLRVHDVVRDDDRMFLVMDLAPGGTLAELLDRHGAVAPRPAVAAIRDVLSALQHAHDDGVVHRDVKPQNILLDARGAPLVADFGIARVESLDLTRTGAAVGTLAYMAPEQRSRARTVDGRADVYAAAGTLFALITGREPLDLYMPTADWSGVPAALVPALRRATSYEREARPTARELADELGRVEAALDGPVDLAGWVRVAPLDPPPAPAAKTSAPTIEFPAVTPPPAEPRLPSSSAPGRLDGVQDRAPAPSTTTTTTPAAASRRWPWVVAAVAPALAVGGWWWTRVEAPPTWTRSHLMGPLPDVRATGLTVSPDGQWVYDTRIDAVARTPVAGGPTETFLTGLPRGTSIDALPDGRLLLSNATALSGPIAIVDGGEVTPTGAVGSLARVDPTGKWMVSIADGNRLVLSRLDGTDATTIGDYGPGAAVYDLCWTQDGRYVVSVSGHGEITVDARPIDGGPPVVLVTDPRLESSGATALGCPYGDLVWYTIATDRGTDVLEASIGGRTTRLVDHVEDPANWLARDLAGDVVAFETTPEGVDRMQVGTVGPDGVHGAPVGDAGVRHLAWLDGDRLAWVGYHGAGIWDAATGASTPLDLTGVDVTVTVRRRLFAVGGQPLVLSPVDGGAVLYRLSDRPPAPIARLPEDAAVACGRERCVVAQRQGPGADVSFLDPATGEIGPPFATVAVGVAHLNLAATADVGRVALFDERGLYLVDTASGGTRRYDVPGVGTPQQGAFSPDGRWLAVTGLDSGEAHMVGVPLDGGEAVTWSIAPGWLAETAFSPTGRFAWVREDAMPDVWVYRRR